jgi:murein DD-endopeptidase / murein LD-carboxypeptidase
MSPKLYVCLICMIFLFGCKHKKEEIKVSRIPAKKEGKKSKPAPEPNTGNAAIRKNIGLSNKEINNSRLYSFVSEWYGTPYKYSGCQRSGVDCSCFSNILYEKVYNKKIPRSANEMFSICKKISIEDAKEGDLLFFKISGNTISHVGVFLRNKFFVHSSTSKGVIISSIEEPYYKKYFYCAGKIRNS